VIHRRPTIAGFIAISALLAAACSGSATAAPTAAANGGTGAGSSAAAGGGTGATASGADQGPLSSLLNGLGALSGGKDPSKLLTADEATSILGAPAAVVPAAQTPISASYSTTSGDNVTIFLESMPGTITTQVLQSALAQANANGELTPISGLGDAAGKEVQDNSATVGFAKNGTLVIITADSSTMKGSDLEPKLESLAQQIVGQF
jgi:hypothetical protein